MASWNGKRTDDDGDDNFFDFPSVEWTPEQVKSFLIHIIAFALWVALAFFVCMVLFR